MRKNNIYNITISNKEGTASYTHYEVNYEEAVRLVNQFGNDPEYNTEVMVVDPKKLTDSSPQNEVSWIH